MVNYCLRCGIELTDKNTCPSCLKKGYYICSSCHAEETNEWRRKNPEKHKIISLRGAIKWQKKNKTRYLACVKKYAQEHYLLVGWVDGKAVRIKVKKHPQTGFCELCDKAGRRFSWHHWDDEHPEKGLWVCYRCHQIAEMIDASLIDMVIQKYNACKGRCESCQYVATAE